MTVLVSIGIAVVLFVALFKACWRVAEPNEALIISGLRQHSPSDAVMESLGFKIVTGKGTFVVPGVQTVRRLTLDLREAELAIDCVTHQGIPLGIKGVVIFKVGDDFTSIANSARRFLDQQDQMDARVHNVFAGHLRAIVGSMTVEEMIRDREKLTQLNRQSSGTEMEKLGLIVDSLQIQEIVDPTGYIENLGRPHAAAVASQARIAQAHADREATEQEQKADALKAEARRESQIKQAELQAQLEEQRLQAQVRKPADAEAYQKVTLARAERDSRISAAEAKAQEVELAAQANGNRVKVEAGAEAEHVRLEAAAQAESVRLRGDAEAGATRAKGLAEGDSVRARGMAEAESIKARADALAENQDAVIGQQLAEQWPAIVEAAAKPFGNIDQMIVLNGAQGLSDALAQALSQGVAGLQLARNLLAGSNGIGKNGAGDPAAVEEGAKVS